MSINIEKLENVNDKGSRIIARCPACAEQGNDNKGEHLSIDDQGRFSCVMYSGAAGAGHRKRIFAMIGINGGNNNSYSSQQAKVIKVKKVNRNTGNIIKSNILGHLGRVKQTLKKHNENDIKERIYNKDFEKGVPSVPSTKTEAKTCDVATEAEAPLTVAKTCSECSNPARFYTDSSGKPIFDKCNVHGERLKVTHAEIDAWSRERERNSHRARNNEAVIFFSK